MDNMTGGLGCGAIVSVILVMVLVAGALLIGAKILPMFDNAQAERDQAAAQRAQAQADLERARGDAQATVIEARSNQAITTALTTQIYGMAAMPYVVMAIAMLTAGVLGLWLGGRLTPRA